MRFLLLFLFLSVRFLATAQDPPTLSNDISRYILYADGMYPELQALVKGKWRAYTLFDFEPNGDFSFEIKDVDLGENGSLELMIIWEDRLYGSGGGMVTKGLQIWDLEIGKRVFNEVILVMEEAFGKQDVNPYIISCQIDVEVIEGNLDISTEHCNGQWGLSSPLEAIASVGQQTFFSAGRYSYQNGQFDILKE